MDKKLTTDWTIKKNMEDIYGMKYPYTDLCYDNITKIVYIQAYIHNSSVGVESASFCNYIGPNGKFCKYDVETNTIYEI